MKRLKILLAFLMLIPLIGLAQPGQVRPTVDAGTLSGLDSSFFVVTFDRTQTILGTKDFTGTLKFDGVAFPNGGGTLNQLMKIGASGDLEFFTDASSVDFDSIVSIQDLQNSLVGSYYNFDGESGSVMIPDNAAIQNIFDNGGSITARIYPRSDGENNAGRIIDKVPGWRIQVQEESAGFVKLNFTVNFDGTDGRWLLTNADIPINKWSSITITYDNSSVSNDPVIYINGNSNEDITEAGTPVGTRITDVGSDLYIGNRASDAATFDGGIAMNLPWNRILTPSEAKEVSEWDSNNPPIWFSDVGASQVPVYESDFSAGADGVNTVRATGSGNNDGVSDGSTSKDDCFKVYATVENNTHYFFKPDWGTDVGSYIKLSFWYYIPSANTNVDGFSIVDGLTQTSTGTVGTWTYYETIQILQNIRFDIRLAKVGSSSFAGVGAADDDIMYVKDITITQLGNVGNWNASGIGHNTWMDASGNDLYGTVSGATYTNIPNEDTETVRQDAITDDTQILSSSNIVPDGYRLVYMTGTETAGNTATLDLGTTAGASDVFSQQVFTASSTVPIMIDYFNLSGSDVALYLNDDGAGTWNSGSLNVLLRIEKIK